MTGSLTPHQRDVLKDIATRVRAIDVRRATDTLRFGAVPVSEIGSLAAQAHLHEKGYIHFYNRDGRDEKPYGLPPRHAGWYVALTDRGRTWWRRSQARRNLLTRKSASS